MKLLIVIIVAFVCGCSFPFKKEKSNFNVRIINEAKIDKNLFLFIKKKLLYWTPKVYEYNFANPRPATTLITYSHGIGIYFRKKIYLPASFRTQGIIQTYIHELTHHATGPGSNMFFREGIATATLEVLLEKENRIADTWPQFGQTNSNWVRLFLEKKDMLSLDKLVKWPGYMGGGENGFRSWQLYVVAGAFIRWYIDVYGYDTFRKAFEEKKLHKANNILQKEWFLFLNKQPFESFSPENYLPNTQRYQYIIKRLGTP